MSSYKHLWHQKPSLERISITIEEDMVDIVQGIFIVAAPLLIHRTALLWLGILAGGMAKYQAWIAFSTDPLTTFCAIACAGAMVLFWGLVFFCRQSEKSHIHGSDTEQISILPVRDCT